MPDRFDFLRQHLAQMGFSEDTLDAWELIPAYRCGELCGAVMVLGSEIHVCAKLEYIGRAITRANIKETLSRLFEKHGFLTTRVLLGGKERAFIERCGFCKTWQDNHFEYFILTELPYSKGEALCHQSQQ